MAQFGETGKVPVTKSFEASFGAMEHETPYVDPMMKGVDARKQLNEKLQEGMKSVQQKAQATTSGGAGTAGQALIPVYVDPKIVDQSRQYTPWTELVPRVANRGITADYNVITDKGDAEFAGEGDALAEQDDSEDRKSESIKYLYAKGKVTGPAQASYPSYMLAGFDSQGSGLAGSSFGDSAAPNAKQLQVLKRARALREREENAIWTGDSSSNSLEYDGLVQLQGTTNQVDKGGDPIDYDDTEDAWELAGDGSNGGAGRPSIAGTTFNVLKQLRKEMVSLFDYRPVDMQDSDRLPFGVSSHMILETQGGPIPVVPSSYMDTTDGQEGLYFLDMDTIEMRVLLDMTYEDKPDEDDNQVFLLKMYETLIMRAPQFNAFVDNIANV